MSVQIQELEMQTRSAASTLADASPLAMGGFATTLLTVSLAMMGFRGASVQTVFVGNLMFAAGLGLLISAQWEMVKGNTFSYTVLSAFGFFYGSYGFMMLPTLGIVESFGGRTPEYYNAMGFFLLIWAVFNLFFLLASVRISVVYVLVFSTVELCLVFDAAAQFRHADGDLAVSEILMTTAGAFAFVAGILGYYCLLKYLCQDVVPFNIPMGDLSRFFKPRDRHSALSSLNIEELGKD